MLLVEGVTGTTGHSYLHGVYPTVERFREEWVETGSVTSLSDLADLDPTDDAFVETVGSARARRLACSAAKVLHARQEPDDLASFRAWA